MHEVERFEHCGVDVRLYADDTAGNPYDDMDQASRIMGFDELHRAGFAEERFSVDEDRELKVLARWLTLFGGEAVAIPFTFSDYGSSGIRVSLTTVDNDRAAGFVVVSREKVAEEWPTETTIDGETLTALEMAERCARAEFETWAAWLEGDVYGYVVAKGTPEEESVWGFYGPGMEYVKEEARSQAMYAAFERAVREETRRMYLLDPDANPARLSWEDFKRRAEDPLRCRYEDCGERHPVAVDKEDGPSERVTCPSCRADMGLDPLSAEEAATI